MINLIKLSVLLTGLLLGAAGCSDDNDPVRTNQPPPPPPPNTTAVNVALGVDEVVGGSTETGSATASFTINLDDQTISGTGDREAQELETGDA